MIENMGWDRGMGLWDGLMGSKFVGLLGWAHGMGSWDGLMGSKIDGIVGWVHGMGSCYFKFSEESERNFY